VSVVERYKKRVNNGLISKCTFLAERRRRCEPDDAFCWWMVAFRIARKTIEPVDSHQTADSTGTGDFATQVQRLLNPTF